MCLLSGLVSERTNFLEGQFLERWLSGLRQQSAKVAMRATASEVRILPLSEFLAGAKTRR
jgi:hypothetical protein